MKKIIFVFVLFLASFGLLFFHVSRASAAAYNASDVLGQTDFISNGTALTQNGFNYPLGSVVDTVNHRLFVPEYTNRRVLVFNLDSSNNLIDHTADYVLGQTNFTTNVAATTQSGMGRPYLGLAFDSIHDRLFVPDAGFNNRVLIFDTTTITNGMNASFVLGQANFTSGTPATTQSGMSGPADVAYDSAHNRLFVVDNSSNRVLIFDTTTITNGMNASFVLGQANFTSGTPATTQSGMSTPNALAYDSINDRLFVDDNGNHRVLIFDTTTITNGMNASFVLGQANFTSAVAATTQSGLNFPLGLSFDAVTSRLFVDDNGSNRVLAFDVSSITNGMNASAVLGQVDFTSADYSCATSQSTLCDSEGLGFDSSNNRLYISDSSNNRVMIFDFVTLTTDPSLPDGTVGNAYSQALATTGDQGTVTTAVTAGTLPPGVTLSGNSLTGTPTTAGSYTFGIQATDTTSVGTFLSPAVTYSVTIAAAPIPAPTHHAASGGGSAAAVNTFLLNNNLPPITPLTPPTDCLPSYQFSPSTGKLCNQTITAPVTPLITTPPSCSITHTLSIGSRGDEVQCLQTSLGGLVIDGIFGPKTKAAVVLFQKNQGLVPDGIVGPKTQGVLV